MSILIVYVPGLVYWWVILLEEEVYCWFVIPSPQSIITSTFPFNGYLTVLLIAVVTTSNNIGAGNVAGSTLPSIIVQL